MLVFDVEIQCDEYQRRCMACNCPAAPLIQFGLGELCNWCVAELWPQDADDEFTPIYRDDGGEG